MLFSKSTNNAMPEVRKSFSTKLTIVERVKGQAFVQTLERQETFMLTFGPVRGDPDVVQLILVY